MLRDISKIAEGVDKKKKKAKSKNLDFFDQESAGGEVYLKQAESMRKILENLLSHQELEVETQIKIKVIDILDYFFKFKQDKLMANLRRVFWIMADELRLIDSYKSGQGIQEVKAKIEEALPDYIKFTLPRIMLTGLPLDHEDKILEKDRREDILDINEILGFELLPVLLQ
mmetsp:Transcript_7634/g.6917  ORF Transcript_7634/g.6917 Transcript_7634/m.6917 type:complete len:171 (-) Transcript_7634:51-563(-)